MSAHVTGVVRMELGVISDDASISRDKMITTCVGSHSLECMCSGVVAMFILNANIF